MANLPLAFAELLAGGVLITAAATGSAIGDVVRGQLLHPADHPGDLGATGATGRHGATGRTGGYTNPVPGATASRVDQGVDYTLGPQGFLAPGRSIIRFVGNYSGFGPYVVGELLDGAYKGKHWFVAEGIAPKVRVGQRLNAGDQVAAPAAGGAIEAGWAQPGGTYLPLAKITGGYVEGRATAAGASFNRFLHALGAPLGHFNTRIFGSLAGLGLP